MYSVRCKLCQCDLSMLRVSVSDSVRVRTNLFPIYLNMCRCYFQMLLFDGSEYPLLESGDVRMYPLPRNHSLHFNVKILTQHAHEGVKLFSEKYVSIMKFV